MNKAFFRILFFVIPFLILGCNSNKEKTVIGIKPTNCNSPTDAIVKFKKIKESDVSERILSYSKSQSIEFSRLEEKEISDWIHNVVFSDKRGYSGIKEWNINDEDICFTQNVRIESASDSVQVSNVYIKICNSVLTKDVSAGNYWEFDSENFIITLNYCFDSLEFIKPVGYYEIVENNGKLERSLKTDLRKHNCLVDINLTFLDKRSNTEYNKQILSDNGFLYTDFRNWK
ncbi:hypothetical protein SAMN05216480_10364 [Pustulibacterium marinum]|uniref:Lipoprotein n=1 Tax=Pustulibacterium marinum TaxID=1224947 RepID=A0A1I7G1M0_9FLAO|nr:hypothetical protein [Pustulibacterium marinum]SFU42335.1 hypothetical protein SAMN05216480_10364 [Pustulibacterium marinum]